MSSLVSQDELLEKFGFTRPGDLRRRLDELRIPYYLGKGGRILTTIEAINQGLIGAQVANDATTILEFE